MVQKQLSYKYQVYNELKKGILTGQYPPGSVMNERKLSEEMGISRTPIREGLQMLARDGWLQMETYKGAVVREFDPHYMWELSRIRYALELSAAEDAVKNMTDQGLERLRQIQAAQREDLSNYNVDEFIRHDREFHSCIYEMSLNRELMKLASNYYDVFRFLGMQAVMGTEERRLTKKYKNQYNLYHIKNHNPKAAVQAMKKHMEQTETNIRRHIKIAP